MPHSPHEPRRVAMCITELDAGGAERAFVQLARGLNRSEWSPTVYCLGPRGPLAAELEGAGVPVVCYGARSVWRLPGLVGALARDLRRLQPALLQTWLFHANIVGRLAGRRAGVPRIVSGLRVAERRGRWRLWLDRATACLVDRHVCVSQAVAKFSAREGRLPPDRLVVIPNGVDFERFASAAPADLSSLGVPAESPVMIFVGRLDPQKDPLLFLEAAERIARARPAVHFVMVGDGPLRSRVEAAARSPGLAGRVHLPGRRDDVPALLRASTCFALTSRWEGFPNVVLEAMAAGVPIVATDAEGVSEAIFDGATGRIVPRGDADAVAAALLALLDDRSAARALARRAQGNAIERFTWNGFVEAHATVYREIVRQTPPEDPQRTA